MLSVYSTKNTHVDWVTDRILFVGHLQRREGEGTKKPPVYNKKDQNIYFFSSTSFQYTEWFQVKM